MVEIKAWFGDWKEVDKETAAEFARHLMDGMSGVPAGQRAARIDGRHIRGITVKELLED